MSNNQCKTVSEWIILPPCLTPRAVYLSPGNKVLLIKTFMKTPSVRSLTFHCNLPSPSFKNLTKRTAHFNQKLITNLKQNEAQSARAESTHKGVNQLSKCVTQVQQKRPEQPMVTFTWHACKYKVHKLHQRHILKEYLVCQVRDTIGDSGLCCCPWVTYFEH